MLVCSLKTKSEKLWLVLLYHQFENPKDSYSVTKNDFNKHMLYIKKSGLSAVTVSDALKEIENQILH